MKISVAHIIVIIITAFELVVSISTHGKTSLPKDGCASGVQEVNSSKRTEIIISPQTDSTTSSEGKLSHSKKLIDQGFTEKTYWWKVKSCHQYGHYVLMYSNDGESFMEINRVPFNKHSSDSTYSTNIANLSGYFYLKIEFTSNGAERGPTIYKHADNDFVYNLSLNPKSGLLRLRSEELGNEHVGIVNTMGRYIYSGRAQDGMFSFDTKSLNHGIYFLRLENRSVPFYVN